MPCCKTHCQGYCRNCNVTHSLSADPAMAAAEELMARLNDTKRMDFANKPDKHLSTDFLYGEARGKMFGVLVCEKAGGQRLTLKAFSGQYNGTWEVDGWVPPLFTVQDFWRLTTPVEKDIKDLGRAMQETWITPEKRLLLKQMRKKRSQELMKQIHALYRLHNFRGQRSLLTDLFPGKQGAPTGTGDCCAPKLLNYAAINHLKPLGLAEFYWGRTNRSATRHQGHFYPACKDKCGPILGFLLCGLEERQICRN